MICGEWDDCIELVGSGKYIEHHKGKFEISPNDGEAKAHKQCDKQNAISLVVRGGLFLLLSYLVGFTQMQLVCFVLI